MPRAHARAAAALLGALLAALALRLDDDMYVSGGAGGAAMAVSGVALALGRPGRRAVSDDAAGAS